MAPDYHVEVQGHFYSVPSRMIRQVVEVRATEATVEVFHRGARVASHARSGVKHRHTTIPEHMPSAHRRYAFWTPARLSEQAEKIGPSTLALCEAIMRAKPHPEQGFDPVSVSCAWSSAGRGKIRSATFMRRLLQEADLAHEVRGLE